MLNEAVMSMMKDETPEEIKATEDRLKIRMIGIELTEIRHNLGVSEATFANMIGVSEDRLEDLELGDITEDELQVIHEAFGI
jgi:DNA-binding transcriptional regulator YiaG